MTRIALSWAAFFATVGWAFCTAFAVPTVLDTCQLDDGTQLACFIGGGGSRQLGMYRRIDRFKAAGARRRLQQKKHTLSEHAQVLDRRLARVTDETKRARLQTRLNRVELLQSEIEQCRGDCAAAEYDPPNPPAAGLLIADHRAADAFDDIPEYWLQQAKELAIHYAHTSHGSQITSGLEYLENEVDSQKYSFAVRTSGSAAGLPAPELPPALRMYDGNPPDTYITPELYWASSDGLNSTRAVVRSGAYAVSLWAWCGQQSSNSEATVQQYLSAMSGLAAEFPDVQFILMTGHTDGGSAVLARNNSLVRSYAETNRMALFDFADIESYDPAGGHHPGTTDACDWCSTWCETHPEQCRNLPDCAHSHGFNCVRKAKAFWWLLARLAGWEG